MTTYTADQIETIQGVVDRVGAYQDGATEATIEQELREGLAEAGVEVQSDDVVTLAEAIDSVDGIVAVADVLG